MRIERRTVVGAAAVWLALTLAVVGVIAAAGGIQRLAYVMAATAAGVAVWMSVRQLAAGATPTPVPTPRRPEAGDRSQQSADTKTTSIEANLRRGADDASAFTHRLQPTLRDLAVHRLRRATGIDAERDPEAARAALGPDLWELLHEPRTAAVSMARITDAVDRIERIT